MGDNTLSTLEEQVVTNFARENKITPKTIDDVSFNSDKTVKTIKFTASDGKRYKMFLGIQKEGFLENLWHRYVQNRTDTYYPYTIKEY